MNEIDTVWRHARGPETLERIALVAHGPRLRRRGRNMSDEIVKTARLMKVVEVMVAELASQGVAETLADLDFDPMALAKVVIKAADGDVIDLNSHR
jgi:hypothetical protein